ncbi:MAG: phycocyanobilin:ferredoxin oxidoreductase [Elainellaceae cyanobacterium]
MVSSQLSLRQQQHPLICQLANAIERIWEDKLTLSPYEIPADLGYIENQLEDERLTIENRCYQTPHFRKIHLELAQISSGLDILHCVMFPRSQYPLPMFGCDIVGARGDISAAIVDLSPIHDNRRLPSPYELALSELPKPAFSQPRQLPEWGDIFSPFCIFTRLADNAEYASFLKCVENILRLHCAIAANSQPVHSETEQKAIVEGQLHYCSQQQKNDKTRRILEKSFGREWTDRYMTTILFDTVAA